jgi:DNA-dependent protein kinase catalytic subunit
MIEIFFIVYPKQIMSEKYRIMNIKAIKKIFIALYFKKNFLEELLSKIIFQGITFSISNKSSIGNEIDSSLSESKYQLYDEYIHMWTNLLQDVNLKIMTFPWNNLNFTDDNQEKMKILIYDKILESSLLFLDKFDLRCEIKPNTENTTSDLYTNSQPKNPKDYELFLNLIEFLKKFITANQKYFLNWIFIFSKNLIEKSIKYPHVSGFYKLLESTMLISQNFNYFHFEKEKEIEKINLKKTTFELINKYKEETISRLHEYKSELLVSCIKFLLSLPKEFIKIKEFIKPITIAFEIGLSYLPLGNCFNKILALISLNSLEKMMTYDIIQDEHYEKILPSLNKYLIVEYDDDDEITETKFNYKKRG